MNDNKFIKFALGFIALVIAGVVLKLAKTVLFPFFLAIFISYIVDPALDFMIKRKVPKSVAIIVLFLATSCILYLLGAMAYSNGKAFASELPDYANKFESLLKDFEASHLMGAKWTLTNFLGGITAEKIASVALSALGPFFSFFSNLLIVLIFLIFILAGRGRLPEKVECSFEPMQAQRIRFVLEKIDSQIRKYLAIKTALCAFNGILVGVVLWLFGVQFAFIFGFLAFFLNFIPNIGSTIATAVPVIIAFFQFGSIWRSLWILGIVVVLDSVAGNFIEPKLMGKGLGLSPLVVIFSLIFWGWLWGIPGMVLAVPIMAVIKIVCANIPSLKFVDALMSK